MMGYHPGDMPWLGMGLCMLVWTTILLVAIWFVVRSALAAKDSSGGAAPVQGNPAEDLLRTRYAAGEIDAEEYQRRLTVLRG